MIYHCVWKSGLPYLKVMSMGKLMIKPLNLEGPILLEKPTSHIDSGPKKYGSIHLPWDASTLDQKFTWRRHRGGQWSLALEVLHDMRKWAWRPSSASCSATISACASDVGDVGEGILYIFRGQFYWAYFLEIQNGYGSIPIDTFLVGWTSIYQLFWGSLGTRVLTHPQMFNHV